MYVSKGSLLSEDLLPKQGEGLIVEIGLEMLFLEACEVSTIIGEVTLSSYVSFICSFFGVMIAAIVTSFGGVFGC